MSSHAMVWRGDDAVVDGGRGGFGGGSVRGHSGVHECPGVGAVPVAGVSVARARGASQVTPPSVTRTSFAMGSAASSSCPRSRARPARRCGAAAARRPRERLRSRPCKGALGAACLRGLLRHVCVYTDVCVPRHAYPIVSGMILHCPSGMTLNYPSGTTC